MMASHQPQVSRKQSSKPATARKRMTGVMLSPSYGNGNDGAIGFANSSGKVPSEKVRSSVAMESMPGSAVTKNEGSGATRAERAAVSARSRRTGVESGIPLTPKPATTARYLSAGAAPLDFRSRLKVHSRYP